MAWTPQGPGRSCRLRRLPREPDDGRIDLTRLMWLMLLVVNVSDGGKE